MKSTWAQAPIPREASKSQEIIAMCLLSASVLPRKSQISNLLWGCPFPPMEPSCETEDTPRRNYYIKNSLRIIPCNGRGLVTWILCNVTVIISLRIFLCNGKPYQSHTKFGLFKCWESAKVLHKRVFALLAPENMHLEMSQMLQKPVFALPGCQQMSVNTLLCDTLALAEVYFLDALWITWNLLLLQLLMMSMLLMSVPLGDLLMAERCSAIHAARCLASPPKGPCHTNNTYHTA